jgi:hypothetical protein
MAKRNGVTSEVFTYDDYLQLRKDAMRIPKQFFYKGRVGPENIDLDNYFDFNQATEEAKEEENRLNKTPNERKNSHPLVPRLNLPRPDPNDQWREMLA